MNKIAGTKGLIEHKEVVKSATNIECIPATEKKMDPNYLKNHIVKPKEICNNVEDTQTDKHIKSSYRFQALSNISDTPDGDRNNPKLKSADLEEDGNVNKENLRETRIVNEISKFQHNLQKTSTVHVLSQIIQFNLLNSKFNQLPNHTGK